MSITSTSTILPRGGDGSSPCTITIDGHSVAVSPGQSVLHAARALGLDIPTLCYLEKCGPLTSCLVCLVKINGKLVPSCGTIAAPGMVVESETNEVHEARRTALELLFSEHVGDCLSPCNRLCPLRLNIPVMLRQVQADALEDAAATVREALPLAAVLGRLCHHPCEQGCRRASLDDAAGIRDVERFVADWDLGLTHTASPQSGVGTARPRSRRDVRSGAGPTEPALPARQPPSGKSVVVIGAGPTGLTAAWHLLRQGHACTVVDRHEKAGGTLRAVAPRQMSMATLDAELQQLSRLGVQFKPGVEVGRDLTIDGLQGSFDAVLLATGEVSKSDGESWGLEMAPGGIKTKPDTFETNLPRVFAAGRSVKPVDQLVRAMADGQAAAECVHRFLLGEKIQRQGKPFSSVMGRLDKTELKLFLAGASRNPSVSPCDTCVGFNRQEAANESARCLHCDCRSSGDCALQSYAQQYGADPSRFRQQRKKFEQYVQAGGVIFEPGKCILCGICVKLTELAREPLGLTFVGRGFDVRVSAPFDHTIEEGLQKVAEECVRHCPTGALVFRDEVQARPIPPPVP
jgi:ferredoxin